MLKLEEAELVGVGGWGGKYETNLSPTTLRETVGTRPLQVLRLKVSLCFSGRKPITPESRNSMTAITSCVHRKKSGVAVVKRTHLFL